MSEVPLWSSPEAGQDARKSRAQLQREHFTEADRVLRITIGYELEATGYEPFELET